MEQGSLSGVSGSAGPSEAVDALALSRLLDSNDRLRALGMKINLFVTRLKRRTFLGSLQLARETLDLALLLVNAKKWQSPHELLQVIRAFGRRIVRARPVELVVGNMIRRVIHAIKHEYFTMLKQTTELPSAISEGSLSGLRSNHKDSDDDDLSDEDVSSSDLSEDDSSVDQVAPPELIRTNSAINESLDPKASVLPTREVGLHHIQLLKEKAGWSLGKEVSSEIREMRDELDNLEVPIAKQALEHIHANDVIMVYGRSSTVQNFLKAAKDGSRRFKVIVVEAAPGYEGHAMALELSELGIPTTLVTDGAVFALMSTVNKVLIGTHAVMANGGLLTEAGAHMVALAAKKHSIPFICITGLYKMCPLFPHNRDAFIDLKSPGPSSYSFEYGAPPISHQVQIVSPSYDYIPPNLVSLFVTNTGGHQPSYIYRLLSDQYDINADEEL